MNYEIIKEKIKQAKDILNEKDIDTWLIFVRESPIIPDPSIELVVGGNCTWQSAFFINRDASTAAIVGSLEQENFEKPGVYKEVIGYLKSIKEPLLDYLSKKNPNKIAVNFSKNSTLADGLTYGMYLMLLDYLQGTGFENKLISSEEIISSLRGRKSAKELEIMKEAVDKTLKIYNKVTKFINPGKSEKDIAKFILNIVKEKGYELAWEEDHCPAVFTGPESGSAHTGPTDQKVKRGHLVNIDFGIKYKGYCSDLQRTWYVLKKNEKKAPAEVQKGFEVIRDSIQKAADSLKPGATGIEIDGIARNYITQNGYEEYPHGLGHQVGRRVHDGGSGLFPGWERYGNSPYLKIQEGQLYTIEPRFTVKDYGRATIEKEVVVTRNGCEFISDPQKKLILIK
ncbi:MAG: M24 family metallopeptidase [Ignavibacteria bacterium]